MFVTYGVVYSFGVFFVATFQEFGWSRAMTAGAFSINQIVYGLSSPLVGLLLDRWGPRFLMPCGACLLSIGLVASSQIDSIWQFYLYYGFVAAIGANLVGSLPNGAVVQRWFARRRGMALGIAVSGLSAGMLVIVPVTQYLVSTIGWRSTYQVLAGVTLLGIVPLTVVFHRRSPQSIGLSPDGLGSAGIGACGKIVVDHLVVDHAWAARQWDVRSAVKTRRFWLLACGMVLAPLGLQALLVHQIAFLADSGTDKMTAAIAFGLVGLISAVFRAVWGLASDRIGREHCFIIASMASAVGIVAIMASSWTSAGWLLWVYTFLFSVGYAAPAGTFTAVAADLFQGRNFGAIYGLLYVAIGAGGAFGPWFAGYSHDLWGSYYAGFSVAAMAVVLSPVFIWLAGPRKVRTVAGKLGPA